LLTIATRVKAAQPRDSISPGMVSRAVARDLGITDAGRRSLASQAGAEGSPAFGVIKSWERDAAPIVAVA
jgi:hypothetical protein